MVKEDMAEVEVTEEDTEERYNWRRKSAVATPDGKSRKEEEGYVRENNFLRTF